MAPVVAAPVIAEPIVASVVAAPVVAAPVIAAPVAVPAPMAIAIPIPSSAKISTPMENPFVPPAAATPAWFAPAQAAPVDAVPAGAVAPAVAASATEVPPVRPRGRSFTWEDFRISPDPIAVEKMKPEAQLRRAKLTRYVKGIVAGCAALCLVALVRSAVASENGPPVPGAAVSAQTRQKVVAPREFAAQVQEVAPAPVVAPERERERERPAPKPRKHARR